jgi:hypothetical protein
LPALTTIDASFNRRLVLFIFASLIVLVVAVVLRVGIGGTFYETTDSIGRPMGFNDSLHAEHYLIMIRNFHPLGLISVEYIYEWVLLAAHIAGVVLLLRTSASARFIRWFFAGQVLLFPFALPSLFVWPGIVGACLTGRMDREGFVDIPFVWVVSHPVWVLTSIIIAFAIRGGGFGVHFWKRSRTITLADGKPTT